MAVLVWLAALFVLFTLGFELWPGASELLRFARVSYERGAVWQLLSSQWVHLSRWHAAGNAFALVLIVFASGFWLRWPLQLLALCGGYAGVALVLALDPDCSYYAGASGALHGLLAGNAVAIAWLARPLRARSEISCAFGRRIRDAMLGAKRAVWLCHTSDSQQRSAPEAGESNVQVIAERALSPNIRIPRWNFLS
jgi:membrane associated rhomboid family serine protease